MKRRIYGIETEFGTLPYEFIDHNQEAMRLLFKYAPLTEAMRKFLITDEVSLSVFLKNEARFYCDTNFHPEYSSPETRKPRDLVRWEKAGERIMEMIAAGLNADPETARWRNIGGVTFLKNNTDHLGLASWGSHQSYLTERRLDIVDIARVLVPFFVSAIIWNGSGRARYSPSDRSLNFSLSQRMPFMTYCLGTGATSDRAMINTRDKPYAASHRWRRLEILAIDSHMSEIVSYLDFSLIGLILEMLEEGFLSGAGRARTPPFGPWEPNDWLSAKNNINEDITLKKVFPVGERTFRALDIQQMYLEVMRRYERAEGISQDQKDALDRFEALLALLEKVVVPQSIDPEERDHLLLPVCDWAAKSALIRNDARLHGYSFEYPSEKEIDRVNFLELCFHDVRQAHGLHYALVRKGLRERLLTEDEIVFAITNYPSDTRAAWRAWWQAKAERDSLEILSWRWTRVQAVVPDDSDDSTKHGFIRYNKDPFQSDHAHNSNPVSED